MTVHDFTDSEGEDAPQLPSELASPRASSEEPQAGPSTEHQPIRITVSHERSNQSPAVISPNKQLRPNLNHLINSESIPSRPPSDRSSLSPPPPITIRLGMKHALVEKATYSSSEDEHAHRAKKAKKSKSKKPPLPNANEVALPAQHRKTYDWLEAGTAAASHHGPPERSDAKVYGWTPEEEEVKRRRHHHRKPTDPPGPGKAWRKGLKKGMAIPWRDGDIYNGGSFTPRSTSPGRATPISTKGSPEPNEDFIPADAEKLGFPIFSKPISAPSISLGPFPRVTQSFGPINGGDPGPFPRREKVRNWKTSEKFIVGIGGGRLGYKTWARGPASELGRLLQADREARELARARKPVPPALLTDMPVPNTVPGHKIQPAERPVFTTSQSFDSQLGDLAGIPDDAPSEIGEEDTKKKKPRAKPRKSKLVNELVPVEAVDSVPEIM